MFPHVRSQTSAIFSFQYVVHGEMLIIIDGKEYLLHDNEIGIIDTSKAHLYAACKDTELLFVRFRGNGLGLVSRIHEYQHAYTPPHINRTYRALTEIAEGFIQRTPLYEEIISSHIHTIFKRPAYFAAWSQSRQGICDRSIHSLYRSQLLPASDRPGACRYGLPECQLFFREVQKPDRNHTKAISDTDTAERSKNTAQRYGLEHKGKLLTRQVFRVMLTSQTIFILSFTKHLRNTAV